MAFTDLPVLSMMVLLPSVGSALILFLPAGRERYAKWAALLFSLVPLALSVAAYALLYQDLRLATGAYVLTERYQWLPSLGIAYSLGADGLSMPLILLTALLSTLSITFSWDERHRPKEYFGLMLVMETGVMGVFSALDFFLFYIFWEVVLIPMYFLIGVWGGTRRAYAAIKFFIYTHVGSVVMLIAIFALYFQTIQKLGYYTFDMVEIGRMSPGIAPALQVSLFLLFFFGFGVKFPMVPFHTWLPDAHVEAPTAGSVLLAGLLLKMGGYGLVRVAVSMLPSAAAYLAPLVALFGIVSILYASFVCLAQDDLKKMVAYSSISHMGFVMLGISTLNPLGIAGGVFQMFNHGLITAVLFMMCGAIHHGTGTRLISQLGGLATKAPVSATILIYGSLASLGLPGLASFISEFMVFNGAWQAFGPIILFVAFSVVVTAGYYLWALQRAVFGKFRKSLESDGFRVRDLEAHQLATLAVLVVLIAVVGIYPRLVLDMVNPVSEMLAAAAAGGG